MDSHQGKKEVAGNVCRHVLIFLFTSSRFCDTMAPSSNGRTAGSQPAYLDSNSGGVTFKKERKGSEMSEEKKDKVADRVGNATEILFSYDTTGSMSGCIADVRKHLEETCEQMFQDIPGLKIGLIAHGDWCDGDNKIHSLPLTNDKAAIFNFIRNAPNTSGGDAPECYELALHVARGLGWSDQGGTGRVMVLIGDATPHEPDYPENTDHLDWRVELNALREMGINVYALQCLSSEYSIHENSFWGEVAERGGGKRMLLNEFCESAVTLQGITYAAAGTEAFATYEKRLEEYSATMGFCCSDAVIARNSVLRGEATKYDELRKDSTDDK